MAIRDNYYSGSTVSRHLPTGERSWGEVVCCICGSPRSRTAATCGDYSCRGELGRRRSEQVLRLDAFDTWSSQMAYAFGLLLSDGCLSRRRKSGSWVIQFPNTDQATVAWFHQFLGNPHKIHVIPRGRHKTQYRSTATSPTLGQRLYNLGLRPRKSWEECPLPEMPEQVLASFMRGFFDGDGGIGMRRNRKMKGGLNLCVTLTCNPPGCRSELGALLKAQEFRPSEHRITLTLAGSDAERFCQWVYGERGPAMARKKQVWEDWQIFRQKHGGLISESDPYETLRGLRDAPWHALVGTMPDVQVARKVGVSPSRVGQVRQALGIPVARCVPRVSIPRSWHPLAGKMTDAEAAHRGGVTKAAVSMYRAKAGIPSFRSQHLGEVA